MANYVFDLQRGNSVGFDTLYPKTIWEQVLGKPSTFTPTSHNHTLDEIADTATYVKVTPAEKMAWNSSGSSLVLGNLATNAYYGDKGKTAYDHSQVAHAPSNAQKNSDITKAEIEAKLIGAITTHTHAYEAVLSAGTTSQYYRGDKTWATFPTLPTNTQLLNADPLRKSGNNIMLYNASGTFDYISLLDFFTYSLAGVGYTQLPNGMIIQYGTTACNGATTYSVTLPIAFSTTNYRVACSAIPTTIQGNTTVTAKGTANTASVMGLIAQYITPTSGGYAGADTTIHWIAIGY